MTLFPVLDRIQRKTKLRGELGLAQPHPDTQASYVHLLGRDLRDSGAAWLALHPGSRLLRAPQQFVPQRTLFRRLLLAGTLHFSFLSFTLQVYASDAASAGHETKVARFRKRAGI